MPRCARRGGPAADVRGSGRRRPSAIAAAGGYCGKVRARERAGDRARHAGRRSRHLRRRTVDRASRAARRPRGAGGARRRPARRAAWRSGAAGRCSTARRRLRLGWLPLGDPLFAGAGGRGGLPRPRRRRAALRPRDPRLAGAGRGDGPAPFVDRGRTPHPDLPARSASPTCARDGRARRRGGRHRGRRQGHPRLARDATASAPTAARPRRRPTPAGAAPARPAAPSTSRAPIRSSSC